MALTDPNNRKERAVAQINTDTKNWLEELKAQYPQRGDWFRALRREVANLQTAIATHKRNLATNRAQLTRGGDDGTVASAIDELERLITRSEARLEALNIEHKEMGW